MARTRITCRGCGTRMASPDDLSHSGLCATCGPARLEANVRGLQTPGSPEHTRWLQAAAAGFAKAAARAAHARAA